VNSLFFSLGIESWKPALTALLLPPVPFLLVIWLGWLARRRRFAGWMAGLGAAGIWLSSSSAPAEWLLRTAMPGVHALEPQRIAELKRSVAARQPVTVIVLGGGRQLYAPEYGSASLAPYTLERLRYGVWLSREIGAPLAFTGGVGHGALPGPSEAEIVSRVAATEFGRPLKWAEGESRDTRENGLRTMALLRGQPAGTIVLVTHAAHMERSVRAFEDAAAHAEMTVTVLAAPIALPARGTNELLEWLPSNDGFALARYVIREKLGLWMGA
jgi:uncharacterized SAM-binding protein YcdF (DUF218 family)